MSKDGVVLEKTFVPAGKLVVREGEKGHCAYLIQSGRVRIFTENKGKNIELAQLSVGDIFGELSLMFNEPRTASVSTIEDTNLIVIDRKTLDHKVAKSDPTVQAIMKMLTKRIVTTNDILADKKSDIDGLIDTSRIIYQNILVGLPRDQQKEFQDGVLPKLDGFLDAIRSFHKTHKD